MPAVELQCPHCSAVNARDSQVLGPSTHCSRCGHAFHVAQENTVSSASPLSSSDTPASPPPALSPRRRLPQIGAAGAAALSIWAAALLIWATVLYVVTDKGTIRIDLNAPGATVRVDGDEVKIENLGAPITLRAGKHKLIVKRGDEEIHAEEFTIKRGENPVLKVTLTPAGKDAPPPKELTNSIGMKLVRIEPGEFMMARRLGSHSGTGYEAPASRAHHPAVPSGCNRGDTGTVCGRDESESESV